MLYIRQILILSVSLYTVRVVLNTLGVEDYGIYNTIGGIVSLFSFFSGTMAEATQRFFSFAIGKGDFEKLKKTFSANCIIYGAIAIIALILLETVGLWFVVKHLNLPIERVESAQLIYHFSVLTLIFTLFRSPFMAIIIAHEDMHIYAYVSIVEVFIKLGIVFLLLYLPWNKLELYGILIFAVSVITCSIYIIICSKKYNECQFKQLYWDKGLLHEILGFTGWTLFGQITLVIRNQAITVLINQVFNPVVVAARAIATSITSNINVFASNFNVGLYPPIIKSYATGNKKEMFSLIFRGSKITFFLLWVFALPLFLEMDTILQIWLKIPPPQAVLFTRLSLIEVLIYSISSPIISAARAPGKMKIYELTMGCLQITIFVISLLILLMGAAAYSVFVVAIIVNLVMFIVRLLIVKALIGLSIRLFFQQVVLPILYVVLFSAITSFTMHLFLPKGIIFSCILVSLSVIITSISVYFIGIEQLERAKVRSIIINRIKKITF